jgi:hypothetical protein
MQFPLPAAGASAVALILLALVAQAAESPATAPTSAPSYAAEQKSALDVLDGAMARFEALLERDDDALHKAATQAVFEGFKQRRAALRQNFDQGKYDELRVDLNLEYQRLASWIRPPTLRPSTRRSLIPATGNAG